MGVDGQAQPPAIGGTWPVTKPQRPAREQGNRFGHFLRLAQAAKRNVPIRQQFRREIIGILEVVGGNGVDADAPPRQLAASAALR